MCRVCRSVKAGDWCGGWSSGLVFSPSTIDQSHDAWWMGTSGIHRPSPLRDPAKLPKHTPPRCPASIPRETPLYIVGIQTPSLANYWCSHCWGRWANSDCNWSGVLLAWSRAISEWPISHLGERWPDCNECYRYRWERRGVNNGKCIPGGAHLLGTRGIS